jgi:outer membrane biosynthesis protein TonB
MSSVTSVTIDKSKHVLLEITSPGSSSPTSLHFTAGSKDVAEAIVTKLESSRDASDGPSVPKAGVSLPPPSPPPPPQPTPPPRPHVAFVDTPAVIAEPEPPSRPPRVESSAIPAIPKPSQPKPSTPSPAPTSRPSTGRASIEKTCTSQIFFTWICKLIN